MVSEIEKTVYVCDYCSKEYLKEQTCINHEKKCSNEHHHHKIIKAMAEEGDYIRMNATSIPQICTMMEEQFKKHLGLDVSVDITSATFSHNVSNSHSCPFNGVKNFHRNPERPMGYIGFRGRIIALIDDYNYKEALAKPALQKFFHGSFLSSFISESNHGKQIFRGINTGTGGGGTKNCQYEVKIFFDDFPELKNHWKKLKLEANDDDHLNELIFYRMM